MCLYVHSSTIHNSQNMETICTSLHKGMDKEDEVPRYNGILLNCKKEQILPLAAMGMDLVNIIRSEVSQKEKDKSTWYQLCAET